MLCDILDYILGLKKLWNLNKMSSLIVIDMLIVIVNSNVPMLAS